MDVTVTINGKPRRVHLEQGATFEDLLDALHLSGRFTIFDGKCAMASDDHVTKTAYSAQDCSTMR